MDAADSLVMGLLSVVDALAHGVVALIPFAIWQRTRVAGFALVGTSFAIAAVMVLVSGPVFAAAGGSFALWVGWRLLGLGVTLLAAVGFWKVYRALRVPGHAAGASTAPGA